MKKLIAKRFLSKISKKSKGIMRELIGERKATIKQSIYFQTSLSNSSAPSIFKPK